MLTPNFSALPFVQHTTLRRTPRCHVRWVRGIISASLILILGACAQLGGNGSTSAAAALATADRSVEDKARDQGRKPAAVLDFLTIGSGMVVMDLLAAGGYYSEVLAAVVGPTGTVYAQNPAVLLKMRDGANDKAMKARLVGGRLPNVVRLDREFTALGLAPNTLDAALTALNLHDLANRDSQQAQRMLQLVHGLLKPGGVLGVIDHVGVSGADNAKLHRMLKSDAVALAEAAGFIVEGDSDLLASATDPHDVFVFDPAVRGQTDRFLLRLRKSGG